MMWPSDKYSERIKGLVRGFTRVHQGPLWSTRVHQVPSERYRLKNSSAYPPLNQIYTGVLLQHCCLFIAPIFDFYWIFKRHAPPCQQTLQVKGDQRRSERARQRMKMQQLSKIQIKYFSQVSDSSRLSLQWKYFCFLSTSQSLTT